MNETPKCPYCGAEMDLYLNVDSNDKWNARYTCAECYSFGPPIIDCEEKSYAEEVALAYTLHRAEPENRPLTLEEVKAHCAKGPDVEPLWIEFSRKTTLSRWILVAPNIECNEPATVTRYLDIWENDYGKTWRCWPRKPTPEQMAAEKWEE